MQQRIAFIGGGNMARAIIGGLLAQGYSARLIAVADPDPAARTQLETRFGVSAAETGDSVVAGAGILVLAVKPQQMKDVAMGLAAAVARERPVVISIAAGITTGLLERWLGTTTAIVRSMPNTPALVGRGAAAMFANHAAGEHARRDAELILRAVGLALWVEDEALLDTVTALSGSGPAYFFLVLEALETAAAQLGLAPEVARTLAIETAGGAAELARQSEFGPRQLREQVTSKGGTTEQALKVLQDGQLPALFAQALQAARRRAQELAAEFGRP